MHVVQNDEAVISGIIDWQGVTVRPLFDFRVPRFLDSTPGELYNLKSKSTSHGLSSSTDGAEEPTAFPVDSLYQLALAHRYIHILSAFNSTLCDVRCSSHLGLL